MTRSRLDQELVHRGLLNTRSKARAAILAGQVTVDGLTATRPAQLVDPATGITVVKGADQYVGRAAQKLIAGLDRFGVAVTGRGTVDVGSSTGGFCDALLQRGAAKVVAVDVGRGQLAPSIRADSRVTVFEGTNIRSVDPAVLGGPFDLVVADLSFISLRTVASQLAVLGHAESDWVLLVKPQFEVGREGLGKQGVVRDAARRGEAVVAVAAAYAEAGLIALAVTESPVTGGSGNREALLWLRRVGEPLGDAELYKVLADG